MSLLVHENSLLTAIKEAFTVGNRSLLKAVDSLPGEFDEETAKQMLRQAPAGYILFLGGSRDNQKKLTIRSHWAFYAVSDHAGPDHKRRHGDAKEIGAYEIIERAIPAIEAVRLDGCSEIRIGDIDNLFTGKLDKRGISAYAATFSFLMPFPTFRDESNDGQFHTYHSDHTDEEGSLPIAGDHPQVHLNLEQSSS